MRFMRLELQGKVSFNQEEGGRWTYDVLSRLRDDVSECTHGAVGDGEGAIGMRVKGLLVRTNEGDASHSVRIECGE